MKRTIAILIVLAVTVLTLSACGHKHTFSEATCTAPRTCEKCGETEGEPLGHTTEIGQCSRCSENQGLEIVMEISSKLENINRTSDRAVSKLNATDGTNVDAMYSTLNSIANIYNSCNSDYTAAIQKCGDYKELATLKRLLQTAKSNMPNRAPSYNGDSMINYMYSCMDYVTSVYDISVELAEVAGLFDETAIYAILGWVNNL